MGRITALFAGVALAATATSAIAADAIVYDPVPTPAPAIYDWTGFYLGGHVGYGWGDLDFHANLTDESGSFDVDGFVGGVQGGYNWQMDRFVFGVEGDWAWSNIDGVGAVLDNPANADASEPIFDVSSVATLRGRLGYAVDNVLFYGTAGGAWARTKGTVTNIEGMGDTRTVGRTLSGWVLGAGVEWGVTETISVKTEYLYHDFGRKAYNFGDFAGVGDLVADSDFNLHTIKLGVNFRF